MSVVIAPQFTQRYYEWTEWKTVELVKGGQWQCDTESDKYTVWFYDGPEVHITNVWRIPVPHGIVEAGYSQVQADSDLAEFEADFLPGANDTLNPRAITGVQGQAPAKGLGGFAPDPKNNPYAPDPDEVVSHYVDAEGQLMVRGPTMTDEGSFRDDFSGSALETTLTGTLTFANGSKVVTGSGTLFTSELNRDNHIKLSSDGIDKWVRVTRAPTNTALLLAEPYAGSSGSGAAQKNRWIRETVGGTPGTVSVSTSKLTLSSGTVSGCGVRVYRSGDYAPMIFVWKASISQRIANQQVYFGLRDDNASPKMYCDVIYSGTDNTKVTFRTAWDGDEESSTVQLPAGMNTSQSLRYKMDFSVDYCSLMVNGVLIARHENHIPDQYADMNLVMGVENSATVTNTNFVVDMSYWANHNQIQIASMFHAPIPVITREDQHHISGKKTTLLTTSNQTILSYTVPDGKVFYLIGYRFDTSGTAAGTLKIGRNDLSSEPASPGSVDDNIFRSFELGAGGATDDVDFGGNPRKLGVGGDTILVVVTPLAALSTIWRATLDFVLR